MGETDEAIKTIVERGELYDDLQFRMLLEELLKRGGRDAEHAVSSFITSSAVALKTRLNIIRVTGYTRSHVFLVPLKKIIDSEQNINLKKEAIIAVSKYNDQRAINILSNALSKNKDSLLQDTINAEISRIKQNNPILALQPKFLQGSTNSKLFRITQQILKKILTPADCPGFVSYLGSEDPLVVEGTFELLCERADINLQVILLDFFKKKIEASACLRENVCDTAYRFILPLETYIARFPVILEKEFDFFENLLSFTGDPRIRESIVRIMGFSPREEILHFLDGLFEQAGLQEVIISGLARHGRGIDMLLHRFANHDPARSKLIPPLLQSEPGCRYFVEHEAEFDNETREIILDNIPLHHYRFFRPLIQKALDSDDFPAQRMALRKIAQNYDYTALPELLSDEAGKRFQRCEEEHLNTLAKLFPVRLLQHVCQHPPTADELAKKPRRFYEVLENTAALEPVVVIAERERFLEFVANLTGGNRRDAIGLGLKLLRRIRTFDGPSFWTLSAALKAFLVQREESLSPEEKTEVKRIRDEFNALGKDLTRNGEGQKKLELFIGKSANFSLLEEVFQNDHTALACLRQPLTARLREILDGPSRDEQVAALQFLGAHPALSYYFRDELPPRLPETQGMLRIVLTKVLENLPAALRIVVRVGERDLYSVIHDQLQVLLPEFAVSEDDQAIQPLDIVIGEATILKSLADAGRLNSSKIYAILSDPGEFAAIRELKPVSFVPPFSLFKVMRSVLRDLFQPGNSVSMGKG